MDLEGYFQCGRSELHKGTSEWFARKQHWTSGPRMRKDGIRTLEGESVRTASRSACIVSIRSGRLLLLPGIAPGQRVQKQFCPVLRAPFWLLTHQQVDDSLGDSSARDLWNKRTKERDVIAGNGISGCV